MRMVIWTFLVFVCSALLLLPILDLGWQIPAEYALYPVYSLIALSFILQWECLSYIKLKGAVARLDAESSENKTLKASVEKQKKKNSEAQRTVGRLENKLAALEEDNKQLEEDLKLKSVALSNETSRLTRLKNNFDKLKDEKDNEDQVLTLLSLLQDNGRFLDFLMDDITSYNDEQVGAASRVVHQGCVKVLKDYFAIEPVLTEEEGTEIKLSSNSSEYRLVGEGDIADLASGRLLHKGWKTGKVNLPRTVGANSLASQNIIAPAEVEAL